MKLHGGTNEAASVAARSAANIENAPFGRINKAGEFWQALVLIHLPATEINAGMGVLRDVS
jgi:hypothetical protein